MNHNLKTWPEPFADVLTGKKTFEYRRNDRDYKEGDTLTLREGDFGGAGMTDYDLSFYYTGREIQVEVTCVLQGGQFGIPEGFCIMSIKHKQPPTPLPVQEAAEKYARENISRNPHPQSEDFSLFEVYRESFLAGHSYKEEGWVRVEDELPKNNGYYIGWVHNEAGLIHYHKDTGWQNGFYPVTHWMPLPQPPKTDK